MLGHWSHSHRLVAGVCRKETGTSGRCPGRLGALGSEAEGDGGVAASRALNEQTSGNEVSGHSCWHCRPGLFQLPSHTRHEAFGSRRLVDIG